MNPTDNKMIKLSYAALIVWAICIFTSFSISAIGHILLFIPAIYFTYKLLNKDRATLKFKIPFSTWALLALIIVGIISVLMNFNDIAKPLKNIFKLKYFLIGILAIPAYIYSFKNYIDEKKIRLIINIFLITTALATISGLIGLFSGFNPLRFKGACHESRACGMYGMYMTYGYGIQYVVILLAGMALFRKKLDKFFSTKILIASLVINFTGLYLSYTRGAWIGTLCAIPFFFWYKNKKIFLVTILSMIILSAGIFFSVPKVKDVFLGKSRQESNLVRISQYKTAIKVFEEKPLFGIGYRNFEPNVEKYKKKYSIEYQEFNGHGHSNFFEHLASTGVFGLIALLLFHIFWFFETTKVADEVGAITTAFIISLFVSGQFQYTIGDGENIFLIMAVYMLFQVYSFYKKKRITT